MTWIIRSCEICQFSTNSKKKFSQHINTIHSLQSSEYVILTKYNGIHPTCSCGCNTPTKFISEKFDFNLVIHGHNKIEISEETRKLIGLKNSIKLKTYYAKNRDIAIKKAENMRKSITDETIVKRNKKIKISNTTEEFKKKISQKSKLFWSEHPEVRSNTTKKLSFLWHKRALEGKYDEFSEKMSFIMTQKLINNERIWYQGRFVSTKTSQICNYKSSYELIACKQLDELDIVTNWIYEPFSIKYEKKGKIKRYVPDFLIELSDKKILLEVKPKKMHKFNLEKFSSAEEYCLNNKLIFVCWEPADGSIEQLLLNL